MKRVLLLGSLLFVLSAFAEDFDGGPWNVSTGNLSVTYIQHSPIGAFPQTNYFEAPPSVESQAKLKSLGLCVNEDYIAWGAVERVPGQWDWRQHDAMERNLHAAGLKYVVYDWIHFPPVWLRDWQRSQRTLMRCLEHDEECHYLSVFDPRTVSWYDHFYQNLHEHFGDKVDLVYACLLGPYGEGNYPLMVPDWVNMAHCHEGYWCGDEFAVKAFQTAMEKKYSRIGKLNKAWKSNYGKFTEIQPKVVHPTDKRAWLDFITWYHQAIIDFSGESIKAVLKYYPPEKVKAKPGGNARGVNPIAWGTYCPGYAKMAGPLKVTLQPADCQGAIFGDKWMGTAYQFYGVKECTEPAGGLDGKGFVQRMFSDISCGASTFFTYEFEQHAADIQKCVHLLNGKSGDTEIAVFCPTTFYRLGGNLQPTIDAGYGLRDLCEFDVLDELLIEDGALSVKKYKTLLIFQAGVVDQPILDKIRRFMRHGGKVITIGTLDIKNVEDKEWNQKGVERVCAQVKSVKETKEWRKELMPLLAGQKGVDGQLDGLWTCRKGRQTIIFNHKDKAVETIVDGKKVEIAAFTIWSN